MEENKNNNQEQVNIDDLKNEMTELEALKAENVRLAKDLDSKRSEMLREYRKVEILKRALACIKGKFTISDADFYAAILEGYNGDLDIDSILYQLSK